MTEQPIIQPTEIPISQVAPKKNNLPLVLGGVVLLLLIIAGSVYAGMKIGEKKGQGVVTPNSIINARPTSFPSVSEVKPTSTTDETVYTEEPRSANWKTYTNTKYGYSIKYPPEAKVGKETGYTEETECFGIKYKLTYITIIAPNVGGLGCLRSGFGFETKHKEEKIIVGDKEYLAKGEEEIGPGETLYYHNESLMIINQIQGSKGNFNLEYGSAMSKDSTYEEYLENKKFIHLILSTFKFLQ